MFSYANGMREALLPLSGGSPAAVNVATAQSAPDAPAGAKAEGSEASQETHTPAGLARESGSRLPQSKAAEAAIAEAERRVAHGLPIAQRNNWLLDIALDHLTQARAALYRALLTPDPQFDIRPSSFVIATALDKLRAANSLNHLPKALLTAAFYHGTLGGDSAEAARLLDEAQQIAERGPMLLYLADVHLHRARLAGIQSSVISNQSSVASGPSAASGRAFAGVDPKAELAKARTLIEQHKYWRRKEELEDAEATSVHW